MSFSGVIAGLGNPGETYRGTRHNLGREILEIWASQRGLSWTKDRRRRCLLAEYLPEGCPKPWLLVLPETFMNASGESLASLSGFHRIPGDAFLVVYDDLGLELGKLKFSRSGSHGGHNGIANIQERMGDTFARLRLGIAPAGRRDAPLVDYVLGPFTAEEKDMISQNRPHVINALETYLSTGFTAAQNTFNRKTSTHDSNNQAVPADLHSGHPQHRPDRGTDPRLPEEGNGEPGCKNPQRGEPGPR